MSGTASWYFEIGCHYGGNPGGSQEDRDLKVLQINTVCGSGSVGALRWTSFMLWKRPEMREWWRSAESRRPEM